MQQRDHFLKQIEELSKLIALLLGLRKEGNFTKGLEKIDEQMKGFSGLSTKEVDEIPEAGFITSLSHLNKTQLDALSQLLYVRAEFLDLAGDADAKILYRKCLILMNHLQETDKVYSMERADKISLISKKLS